MRKIKFSLLFMGCLLVSYLGNAQFLGETVTLESYEGEWKWETGDECLIIYLRDTTWKIDPTKDEYYSDIIGTYKYIKGNTVVVDNTGRDTIPWYMPIYASKSRVDEFGHAWELRLLFTDTITGKESNEDYSTLIYSLGRKAPQLQINIASGTKWYDGIEDDIARTPEEAAKLKRLSSAAKLPGWSIPNNVMLTKVVR